MTRRDTTILLAACAGALVATGVWYALWLATGA